MEMKKCKECGKLFTPKSMRSQYCDALHYRPCPVCGKQVEAKYLSDPPRCCSKECQQAMRKQTNSTKKPAAVVPEKVEPPKKSIQDIVPPKRTINYHRPTVQRIDELFGTCAFGEGDENAELEAIYDYEDEIRDNYICATYINKKEILHFVPGHEYALEITREKDRPYRIHAVYDFNKSQIVSLDMDLSSRISINQNFTKGEVRRLEDGTLEIINNEPVYDLSEA